MPANSRFPATRWLTSCRTVQRVHGVGCDHCSARTPATRCPVASRLVLSSSMGVALIRVLRSRPRSGHFCDASDRTEATCDGGALVRRNGPGVDAVPACAPCDIESPTATCPGAGAHAMCGWVSRPRPPSSIFGLDSCGGLSEERAAAAVGDGCLLYTSDAADEEDSVDLGGRR